MKTNSRLCIIIMILPLVFFSCIGISSEIWFHEDGSGKIQLEYRMPELLIESMKNSDDPLDTVVKDGIEIPAFLSEYNIRRVIEDLKTLTLSDYKVFKNDTDIYIFYEILFSSAIELQSLELMPEVDIQYNSDGTVVFEQAISLDSSMDNEDKEVFQLYENYENTYIVHAPMSITSYNIGALSKDRKTVVFKHNFLFPDINNSAEKTVQQDTLIVEW